MGVNKSFIVSFRARLMRNLSKRAKVYIIGSMRLKEKRVLNEDQELKQLLERKNIEND